MKKGWTYKQLGDVCEILDSKRKPITKGKREPGSIPYYGATGCLDYVKDYIFDEKLVLLGEDGAKWGPGESSAYIISGKSWVNNHAHALRPKREIILDEILVYYLNYSNLQTFITGVTVPKLNQEKMRSIEVPVAPISEQERIVERLDAAFAQIDELKSNAEKQLAEARALFQSALTQAMQPKPGWQEKNIKELSIIAGDYGLSVPSKPYDGVRYLRITDITEWGELNNEFVSADISADDNSKEKLEEGDILFARTGATVGKTLVYKKSFGECLFAGYLIRYRLNKNEIMPQFMHYITHSKEYYDWVQSNQKAAAQPNINAKKYNSYIVRYPKLSEQESIVTQLDALFAHIRELEEISHKTAAECDALKQALLRQIFE